MALPIAHISVALGTTRKKEGLTLLLLALFSLLPDFDFALVWGLDLPTDTYHRTFSHSLGFFLGLAGLWKFLRPRVVEVISPLLVFVVLTSHSLLDLLCTADAADHGVMLFWPLSDLRLGWPVLVPLYRLVAETPFTADGAFAFSLLETLLALPLWLAAVMVRESVHSVGRVLKSSSSL